MKNAHFVPQILTGAFADAWFADMETWSLATGVEPLERLGDTGVVRVKKSPEPVVIAW